MMQLTSGLRRGLVVCALLAGCAAAHAQFAMVPTPLLPGTPRASETETDREYKIDAARHIYAAYSTRVFRGKMPPLLYGIMMVEVELDAAGQVINVNIVRKPAAADVAPWVSAMIRRAAPFPAPARMANGVKFSEIWLVDKSGMFQLDTLTEGQH